VVSTTQALLTLASIARDPAPELVILVSDESSLPEALSLLSELRSAAPCCAVVALGAALSAESITQLLAAGVHDFVSAASFDAEFSPRVRRALGAMPAAPPRDVHAFLSERVRDLIGTSPSFTHALGKLPTIAGCDAGVLILGETGTGKELCAQAVHYLSARASKPWITVNCGAIPLELIESELFGHVRGAYTTAHTSRQGLVAEAEGGSLFLDDIDCLPLAAQSKLLRFLQEREYRAVGSNAMQRADVRVIAASNRNLGELATGGMFRQDLYFRLNVLTLWLPPLRERREDIAALSLQFMRQFARRFGRHIVALSPQALRKLLAHDWPGNVRELQHVIERAVLLAVGPTLSQEDIDISGDGTDPQRDESFRAAKARVVQQFERSYIEHLLAVCEGNVTHAAKEAKKDRRAFFSLIRKHGIAPERFRAGWTV
jgi:two-component system response regulator GlrR